MALSFVVVETIPGTPGIMTKVGNLATMSRFVQFCRVGWIFKVKEEYLQIVPVEAAWERF